MFVILTSATNGYDGSMVNGLQSLDIWQDCKSIPLTLEQHAGQDLTQFLDFNHPTGSTLGLFNCIMAVGSLAALPVTPYIADGWGRRAGIMIGCVIM